MKTKQTIVKQLKKKGNKELVETIILAKKAKEWIAIAEVLSSPSRQRIALNLDRINKEAKEEEIIIVPGKILSLGELNKKIKLVGLAASSEALEKIKNGKSEFVLLKDEIKNNPEAKGVRIIK